MAHSMTPIMTTDDFAQLVHPDRTGQRLLELIHGEMVEKATSPADRQRVVRLAHALTNLSSQSASRLRVRSNLRFETPADRYNSHLLDIALFRRPDDAAPALAIEFSPPDLRPYQMRQRAETLLRCGLSVVWIIDSAARRAEICTLDDTQRLAIVSVPPEGHLYAPDVLPRVRLPLAAIVGPQR